MSSLSRLFLGLGLFALSVSASCQLRTPMEALALAQEVLVRSASSNRSAVDCASLRRVSLGSDADSVLFLFSAHDCFAVVAADVRANGVLAYSVESAAPDWNENPALRDWVRGYAVELRSVDWTDEALEDDHWAPVLPLVTSAWNQSAPYNSLCPVQNGSLCVTGCVATAMAQVMNYWQWPVKSKKIPAYSSSLEDGSADVSYAGFAPTTIDWESMRTSYESVADVADASVVAVSSLMRLCGQAVQMCYGVASSAAQSCSVPSALRDYFGYDGDVYRARRECFSSAEWESFLYDELSSGRPVIYSASCASTGVGHCFVVDGVDANHFFHVNWGWGGSGDGYYQLSALRPSNKNFAYDSGHDAIVGIQKEDGVDVRTDRRLTVKDMNVSSKGVLSYDVCNRMGIGDEYELALVCIDENGNILSRLSFVDVWGSNSVYLDDNFYCPLSSSVASFTQPGGKLSTVGTHLVSVACRVVGSSEFRLCNDWQDNCVAVTVSVRGVRTSASYAVVSVGATNALRVVSNARGAQPAVYDVSGRRVWSLSPLRLYVVDGQLRRK